MMFKQTDVTRAIRAAQAAGILAPRVEITRNGSIVIIPASDDAGSNTNARGPADEPAAASPTRSSL